MTNLKIARVFPRKTNASPVDDMAFFGPPPEGGVDVDSVHISVVYSYDIAKSKILADAWGKVAPVEIGGPAIGDRGDEFVPGMYVRKGYVITSRGCPNRCRRRRRTGFPSASPALP